MKDNNTTKRLQKYFNFSFKKNDQGKRIAFPGALNANTGQVEPIRMTTEVQRQFIEWQKDLVSNDDLRNRLQRYADLDFMVCNCGYIQTAIKLYSNETISPDENGKVINVYAKDKKVESYINDFLFKIGVTRSVLEDTSYNIAKYSDAFWIRSINPEDGIYGITPLDVRQIHDRIEFSAIDELSKKLNKNNWQNYSTTGIKFSDVVDALLTKIKTSDYAAMYKRYLFGFSLGAQEESHLILPPWAISHFRRFNTQSEFAPFGRPLLINSLGLFREYKSDLNLLQMARVAKFPKEIYSVVTDPSMSPTERLSAINEARQEYENLVNFNNSREEFGIGSSIWVDKDTVEYDVRDNNLNLDDIADVELLKDELITSTLIPKGYLINGDSSWDSGKALLQQSKLFAREVFTNQTSILTELTDLIKTQFVLLDMFDLDKTEFELSLSFPNSEQTSDAVNVQKDTMDLANATIENLKTALAIDSIPPEVAKDIFKTYSSIKSSDLDRWFNQIKNSTTLQVKQADDFEKADYKIGSTKENKKINEALVRLNEDIFREALFNAKKSMALNEGVIEQRHFVLSYASNSSDTLKFELMKEFEPNKNNSARIND